MSNLGFIRVAAITPKLIPANTEYNEREILGCLRIAERSGCGIALFPELCLTGSTCGDLFHQRVLYEASLESLKRIAKSTEKSPVAVILGLYLEYENLRFNCAALIQNGQIKGIVPKMSSSHAQAKWFSPGHGLSPEIKTISLFGQNVPFGRLLFKDNSSGLTVGIEVGDDRRGPVSPGSLLALEGAVLLLNPSAEYEAAGKSEYNRRLILSDSSKLICGYVTASAGVFESTTDYVFSGQNIIAENGNIVSRSNQFVRDHTVLLGDIDYGLLRSERMRQQNFSVSAASCVGFIPAAPVLIEPLKLFDKTKERLLRTYPKNPFLPEDSGQISERCSEVFQIQCAGLAKRLEHTKAAKTVIGVSGGLDSTLSLLVCAQTHKLLGKTPGDIIALTMPGFGTTGKTYNNALSIMKLLGTDMREVSIKGSVLQHFKDIGHDADLRDVTYENAQARERTQILMDVANKERGLLVGTGDLSEAALGWCTFNGDHMSMYNVNAGVPKTFIRHIIRWFIDCKLNGPARDSSLSADNALLGKTLQEILATPISPELLPPDKNGEISQKTEDSVGPYPLNDFFLFYTIRYGIQPEKLLFLARLAFEDEYGEDVIRKWLDIFYKRFFSQQFKRNCAPEGPKAFSVGLSPRGDLVMPSDADFHMWSLQANG